MQAKLSHTHTHTHRAPCRVVPSSWKMPSFTSLNEMKTAPSSWREREWGGMEPGVIPPISAWCPRLATKNTGLG